jgi:hypothetical protein
MHRGLATALVALALAAAGCHREPTFNNRYDETARNIKQRAATLENELNQGAHSPRTYPAQPSADVEPNTNSTRHRSAEGRKARW